MSVKAVFHIQSSAFSILAAASSGCRALRVAIGGQRTYKCGGECTFEINLTSIEVVPAIEILDMSNMQWNWEIRTASQHFADNVAFFDDQIEFIQMAIRQERLEFEGVRTYCSPRSPR